MNIQYLKNILNFILKITRIIDYFELLFFLSILIFFISPISFFSKIIFLFANFFILFFIFIFNDVEDADDDFHVLEKRKKNLFSNGTLSKKSGYIISFLVLFSGLFLFYFINRYVFVVACILGLTGLFYSWKSIRFKSIPIIDIVSHGMILGGFQILTFYLTFNPLKYDILPFIMVFMPFSFGCEFFQELRDFHNDKKTKINNTIQKIGKIKPRGLMVVLSSISTLGYILLCYTDFLKLNMIYFFPLAFLISLLILEFYRKKILG